MKGELSHGLPPLVAAGCQILRRDTMEPVLLRGVNRPGLEYAEPSREGFLAAAQFSRAEMEEIVLKWRANIVRIPFNQDWALRGRNNWTAEDYRAALDQVIEWAAALGAYTILDLHWLDADTLYGHSSGKENHIAPLPNAATLTLWTEFAARYRDEPAVLFDLYNEPHSRLADDFLPILHIKEREEVVPSPCGRVGPEEWACWARCLVSRIRRVSAESLILVSGVDWGFDLRRVHVEAPNVLYAAHIYPNRCRAFWGRAFPKSSNPDFVTEWGGEAGDLEFGKRLARFLRRRGCGWTAWSWTDHPRLVEKLGNGAYQPTPFGMLVREELWK